jgi:hypothetical protein
VASSTSIISNKVVEVRPKDSVFVAIPIIDTEATKVIVTSYDDIYTIVEPKYIKANSY